MFDFLTKVQDCSVPKGAAKCTKCKAVVPATFAEINTHRQSVHPPSKATVGNDPKKP